MEGHTDKKVQLDQSSYTLTTEDYENIWLRIKDKLGKWIFSWLVLISAIVTLMVGSGLYGLYGHSKKIIERETDHYIQSPEFKKEVNLFFQKQFDLINNKIILIDEGLAKLAIYGAAPYKITDNGFILVDSKGNYTIVEYGGGVTNNQIKFKSQFKRLPRVVITQLTYDPIIDRRVTPLIIAQITPSHFTAKLAHTTSNFEVSFNWIAIGK